MTITDFTLKLMLLFFPGIICAGMVGSLTIRKSITPFYFVIRSFVFGMASYFLYWAVRPAFAQILCLHIPAQVYFVQALTSKEIHVSCWEIFYVSISAVLIAIAYSVAYRRKWYYRITRWCGITNRPGDSDTWEFAFGMSPKALSEWVTVRDHKYDLRYEGWVMASSDDSIDAELLLRDVAVYRNSSKAFLYQVGALYLSRDRTDLTIEFTAVPVNDDYKVEQSQENEEDDHVRTIKPKTTKS